MQVRWHWRAAGIEFAVKMGELAAKHLKRAGVSSVLVTNRTFERAVELAQVFEGAAVPFEHFTDHMDRADIVISGSTWTQTWCPPPAQAQSTTTTLTAAPASPQPSSASRAPLD